MKKILGVLVAVSVGGPASTAFADALVRTASGSSLVVTDARDAFRADIGGGTTAGANGSFGGLRREINWDGVPDTSAAPHALPANFFNSTSPRGVVFTTPGTGFQVSADSSNTDSEPVEFGGTTGNATYPATFAPFSAERLFTALGSTTLDVDFFLPNTTTKATVTSFGAIFSDVDTVGSTSIEYFDQFNNSLGKFDAPAAPGSENFSFLGVTFTGGEKVAYARITAGNAAFNATDSPSADVVVMDDFLYSEPVSQTTLGAITVSAPNGGETLSVGATQAITWTPSLSNGTVKIELSRNGGTTFETLFASTADDGTENWTVSGPATTQALIRITSTLDSSVTDTSNAAFSIGTSSTTLPDLRVSLSSVRLHNGTLTGKVKVGNGGPGAAGASTVSVFSSSDTSVGVGDSVVVFRSVPPLASGASQTYSFSARNSSRSSVRVLAFADSKGEVAESNEANNATNVRSSR